MCTVLQDPFHPVVSNKCVFYQHKIINFFVSISAEIREELCSEVFEKVDSNEDQKITGDEIIQHTFAKIDTDGDGKLSKEEFVNACLASEEISKLFYPNLQNSIIIYNFVPIVPLIDDAKANTLLSFALMKVLWIN